MTAPRPICAHCGSPYGQRARKTEPVVWRGEPTFPTYRGNHIVLKEWRMGHRSGPQHSPGSVYGVPFTEGDYVGYRDTWDGETWWTGSSHPFCTGRCAVDFARKAFKAGWRP